MYWQITELRLSLQSFRSCILMCCFISCDKADDTVDECAGDNVFRYDSATGQCVNCRGEVGYNPFDLEQIRMSKSAECMEFPQMHLVFVLDTANIENFHEVGDNIIGEYNFKGADINATHLNFNKLIDCNFEGTKMSQFSFGYATVHGKIDSYTEYPAGCPVENDTINCRQ